MKILWKILSILSIIVGGFFILLSLGAFLVGYVSLGIFFIILPGLPLIIFGIIKNNKINKIKKNENKKKRIEEEKRRLEEKQRLEEEKEKKIKEYKKELKSKYGKFWESVYNNNIELGMNQEMINLILGKPGETKNDVSKDKVKKTCLYQSYKTDRGTIKYKYQIFFENDIVSRIKEL